MRLRDFHDYQLLRRFATNPWQIVQFRKAQQEGQELTIHLRGGAPLYVRGRRHDYHVFNRIFVRDEYRLDALGQGRLGCVIDLGANVGIFSARAAEMAERVIAYEPFPDNYVQLEKNMQQRANVTPVRAAVAGEPGRLRLFRPRGRRGSGLVSALPERAEFMSDRYVDVPAGTLDELFDRYAVDTCDLLKIDVEGGEYDILYAASAGTLGRIARIHGEYHHVRPEDPRTRIDALVSFLASHGFVVDVAPHEKHENHGMFFAARDS